MCTPEAVTGRNALLPFLFGFVPLCIALSQSPTPFLLTPPARWRGDYGGKKQLWFPANYVEEILSASVPEQDEAVSFSPTFSNLWGILGKTSHVGLILASFPSPFLSKSVELHPPHLEESKMKGARSFFFSFEKGVQIQAV